MPFEIKTPALKAASKASKAVIEGIFNGTIDVKTANQANRAIGQTIKATSDDLRARLSRRPEVDPKPTEDRAKKLDHAAASTIVLDASMTMTDVIVNGSIDPKLISDANKAIDNAMKALKRRNEIAPLAPERQAADAIVEASVDTVKAVMTEIKSRKPDPTPRPDVRNIDVGLIQPSFHARQIDADAVAELAGSMREVGLLSPIVVRAVTRHRNGAPYEAFEIVAGHHRHAATKSLGWTSIACAVVALDDMRAELAELDENLIRANLTAAQEAAAISRRKAIYESLHPETKAEAFKENQHTGKVAGDNLSFASATAEATGKNEQTIERAAARGEALGDDLKAVEGTSLDRGVELDALARLPAEERAPLIEKAKAGEKVSARKAGAIKVPKAAKVDAARPDIGDVEKRQTTTSDELKALMTAWTRAGPEARKTFLLRINATVG